VLIPILYLKGISTGDFEETLIALLGKDAGGLSASTIGWLKEAWSDEHTRWSKRDLSAKRYVYFWVDGIHVQARLEEAAQCLLVIIGATPEGKKELVGTHRRRPRERAIIVNKAYGATLGEREKGGAPSCASSSGQSPDIFCPKVKRQIHRAPFCRRRRLSPDRFSSARRRWLSGPSTRRNPLSFE
jgi:hypothetical protein